MTEMGIRAKMLVKDVMSSPTITINEKATAQKTAQLMEKYKENDRKRIYEKKFKKKISVVK